MTMAGLRDPYLDPVADRLLARVGTSRKALFLDRDGVINVNHGYVHAPAQTDWVPGIFELVGEAHARGYLPIVATNQAGIGRGYYDEDGFLEYTAWMQAEFARRDAPLLATYWCPHHPDAGVGGYRVACACRKPRPGMLLAAIAHFGIDPAASIMVGDSPADIEAAQAAGVRGHLLHAHEWGVGLAGLLDRVT